MKNVLTPILIATPVLIFVAMAGAALAQPATPGQPTGGNMQQMPTETPAEVVEEGESVMPDGAMVGTMQPTTGGQVRVRMPDGKLLDIPDSADVPWYRNEQMGSYTSYYFDPANRVYVVRDGKKPANWPDKNWGVE